MLKHVKRLFLVRFNALELLAWEFIPMRRAIFSDNLHPVKICIDTVKHLLDMTYILFFFSSMLNPGGHISHSVKGVTQSRALYPVAETADHLVIALIDRLAQLFKVFARVVQKQGNQGGKLRGIFTQSGSAGAEFSQVFS